MISHLRARLPRFHRDQRGVSAVEFALLLPLMIAVYLGGVEISQAISIDRKVSLTARAVADLVARTTAVTETDLTNVLDAAAVVTAPYPASKLKVKLSSVSIDGNGKATIDWSRAKNTTQRPKDQDVTNVLPAALAIKNSSLIWAEVEYGYDPTIGYVITGTLTLTDQIYMRPRLSEKVAGPA